MPFVHELEDHGNGDLLELAFEVVIDHRIP